MPPRKPMNDLPDRIRGEHLGLCVAAHLSRTQLVADPLQRYDGQHLMDMVEGVARALVKVAPLYVRDNGVDAPRELTAAELDGAAVQEAGRLLVLRDGRRYTSMTIKRIDLRQAIAILRATGVPELHGSGARPQAQAAKPAAPVENPRVTLARIEALLRPPLLAHQLDEASRALVSIARHAERGRVANLAMQLMSAVQESNEERLALLLAQLRSTLEETAQSES